MDHMEESMQLESEWEHECSSCTGLNSYNPKYKQYYKEFVVKKSMYFKEWDPYRKALSLMHTVKKYKIWDELKKYFNSTVDFLHENMDPTQVIACMHQITLLVVGNMSKFWSADCVGVMLSHSLRHCVPKASSGMMGQRICGWNFKHWEGDSARMNLINLPMMDSVVFKKLVDKSVATADASGTGNVGGEVQQSKKPSKRGVLPEAVSAELEELGIKKKRKVVAAQSEPQWHEPADDGNAPQISFGGDVDMDDESGSQQRGVPKLSEQKLKKSDKKSSFVAWTDDEKKKFLKTVAPLNCSSDPEDDPGTRSLTAIDDFMQAMRYAEMVVKARTGDTVSADGLASAFEFTAGIFLQFVFESRVCLNGKDLRVWSSLRPELQATFLSAFDAAYDFIQGASTSASGSAGSGRHQANAFELAKALCESFVNKPVTMIIMADDEELAIKRIAATMTTKGESLVQPLKNFLEQSGRLPPMMQPAVRDTVATLLECKTKRWALIDLICYFQNFIDKALPPAWIAFAADVIEIYTSCMELVEGSKEVFSDAKHLEKFIGLRFEYLLNLLNACLSCVPELVISDVSESTGKCLAQFLTNMTSRQRQALVSFDVLLGAPEWGKQWTSHLREGNSIQDVVESVSKYVSKQAKQTTSQPGGEQQSDKDATGKSETAQSVPQPSAVTASSLSLLANLNKSMQAVKAKGDDGNTEAAIEVEDGGDKDKDKDKNGKTEPVGSTPGGHEDVDGKTQSEQLVHTINKFNNFVSESFKQTIIASKEWKALSLDDDKIDASFFKVVELNLNATLWSAYEVLAPLHLKNVYVNLGVSNKAEAVQVSMPVPNDLLLPLVHRIVPNKPKNGYLCCSAFGVDWWMEPGKDPLSSDFCVPGWAAKTVTRMDQAYFQQTTIKLGVVFYKLGKYQTNLTAMYLPDMMFDPEQHKQVSAMVEGQKHVRVSVDIQALIPVSDLDDKLEKEVTTQKDNVEKTVRTMITNAQKAAAKSSANSKQKASAKAKSRSGGKPRQGSGAGGSGSGAASGVAADPLKDLLASLGVDCPEKLEDREKLVNELISREDKLEEIASKAREAIVKPDKIPITRMVAQEEKNTRAARARVMQEALAQAQKAAASAADPATADKEKLENKDTTDPGANAHKLGPLAYAASIKGGSKLFKSRTTSGKKTDQSLAHMIALGKHLLK